MDSTAEVVAVAAVADGSSEHASYRLAYHRRALELLTANAGAAIDGLMPVGAGVLNVMACWGQAALLGIPLIDASFEASGHPCPWRAFVDLLAQDVSTISVGVVGKSAEREEQVETFLRGGPRAVSGLIDELTGAGGSHALCFGPLSSGWMRGRAEIDWVSRLIEVGDALMRAAADGGRMVAQAACNVLSGQLTIPATVVGTSCTKGDDDSVGVIDLLDEDERRLRLTHWHRYLVLEREGHRLATFPDLVVTLGARGTPLQAAELSEGQDIFIITARRNRDLPIDSRARDVFSQWLSGPEVQTTMASTATARTRDGTHP
jgi:hypothetical protein